MQLIKEHFTHNGSNYLAAASQGISRRVVIIQNKTTREAHEMLSVSLETIEDAVGTTAAEMMTPEAMVTTAIQDFRRLTDEKLISY